MKKLFYFMLVAVLPLLAISLTSCSNDDDLPQVVLSLDVLEDGNVVVSKGTVYAVAGAPIILNDVLVKNQKPGEATINMATFLWDAKTYARKQNRPFNIEFEKDLVTKGNHTSGLDCQVLAEGYPFSWGYANFPVVVVESQEDLPVPENGTLEAVVQLTENAQ